MNALVIDEKDNVAVVTGDTEKGASVTYTVGGAAAELTAETRIPVYHKIAIRDIEKGEKVVKYGHVIGEATEQIKKGEHVHCHNVVSSEEGEA